MCNPNAQKVPGTSLFVNDRIIVRENMSVDDERVVNGDTGTIKGFTTASKDGSSKVPQRQNSGAEFIILKLDDGREIRFPGQAATSLQHSYALTVHSAQGSQYKRLICAITGGQATFINRTMLYTGLSRARESLTVYGDDAVLKKIALTPAPERNSALVERVRALLDDDEDQDVLDDREGATVSPPYAMPREAA